MDYTKASPKGAVNTDISVPEEEMAPKRQNVTVGEVNVREQGKLSKVFGVLFEVCVDGVKDIIKPTLKDMANDYITNAVTSFIYHDDEDTSDYIRRKRRQGSHDYTKHSKNGVKKKTTPSDDSEKSKYVAKELVYHSRDDAMDVLEHMIEDVTRCDSCSVGAMLEYSGVSQQPADWERGWTNLDTAKVIKVSDGYIIKLPKTEQLD